MYLCVYIYIYIHTYTYMHFRWGRILTGGFPKKLGVSRLGKASGSFGGETLARARGKELCQLVETCRGHGAVVRGQRRAKQPPPARSVAPDNDVLRGERLRTGNRRLGNRCGSPAASSNGFQRHVPMGVPFSVAVSKGLSLSQWMLTGTFHGVLRSMFTFVSSGAQSFPPSPPTSPRCSSARGIGRGRRRAPRR